MVAKHPTEDLKNISLNYQYSLGETERDSRIKQRLQGESEKKRWRRRKKKKKNATSPIRIQRNRTKQIASPSLAVSDSPLQFGLPLKANHEAKSNE
ncbi:hypothetical protein CEXT_260551 [Caerostris extrusa]|uniref:Uncharacterized protein n=1 Tax=Caerostris extrusa TaxID=172846 RepID=A0AAV4UFD2_CAEEX|nr:hypothetical protein CEXT_260551 [Caerostris extrusa]